MQAMNMPVVNKPFGTTIRLLVALLLLGSGLAARAAEIYVLTNDTSDLTAATTNFGSIDTTTGAYTNIATLAGATGNLAWNPAAQNFFVTNTNSGPDTLNTLTTTGTLSAPLGTIGAVIYGMAYRTADSTLYGYDFGETDTGTIDPSTGFWTRLNRNPGFSGGSPVGGRYSILDDTLYVAYGGASRGIGTIGYTETSTLSQIVPSPIYANMVLANDGTTMYGLFGDGTEGSQLLYTIDTDTGVVEAGPAISGTGLGTYFHGAGMVTAVPEPATCIMALAGLACGGLAMWRRRQRA